MGKPEGLLCKNAEAETQESDPEHTVRCVQRGDLRLILGSFGGEGAKCISQPYVNIDALKSRGDPASDYCFKRHGGEQF